MFIGDEGEDDWPDSFGQIIVREALEECKTCDGLDGSSFSSNDDGKLYYSRVVKVAGIDQSATLGQ